MITVKVAVMPGAVKTVELGDGATVGDAIRAAGVETAGYEIRVGGANADVTRPIVSGETVLMVKMVKGN